MPIISVFVCRCTLHKENASVEAVLPLVRKVYLRNKKSGTDLIASVCRLTGMLKAQDGLCPPLLFFDEFYNLVNSCLDSVNVLAASLGEVRLSATAALD